jgi:predicted transcriptional regulator
MPKETVTVRIEPGTREALDHIAVALDRDRTYVVNAALEAYIDLHRWQLEHIQQGLDEANRGEFVAPAKVTRTLRKLGVNAAKQ